LAQEKRSAQGKRQVGLQTVQHRIDLLVRGERFASYRYGPEELPGFTALYAPGERPVTREDGGPAFWIGHEDVNGVSFSPWHEAGDGQIVPVETTARRGGLTVGFQQRCEWRNTEGHVLLKDRRTVRALPGPGDGRILDLELRLTAPLFSAVEFGRTRMGFVAARANGAMFAEGLGQVRNSRGDYGPEAVDGSGATWCACVAVVDGLTVGFAWLDHPANPWHPPSWRCSAEGVLSPVPLGGRSLQLEPGQSLTLRYRLHIHEGYVNAGWPDARLEDYAKE
jgi:hypothetical protein